MRLNPRIRSILHKILIEGYTLEWSQGNIGGGYALVKEGVSQRPIVHREVAREMQDLELVAVDRNDVGRMVFCVTSKGRATLGF